MKKQYTFLFLLFSLVTFTAAPVISSETGAIRAGEVTFNGANFGQGSGENIVVQPEGLALAGSGADGYYLSPVINAPIPFNALFPQWQVELPPLTHLEIQMRTAAADGQWSDWHELHESHDLTLPEDEMITGEVILAPSGVHTQVQFAIEFSRLDAAATPRLNWLRLHFVDATQGPTAEEMVEQQAALDAAQPLPQAPDSPYPKPAVVSRAVWCTHPACHNTNPQYRTVTHLILHHTAGPNSSDDWAAAVRAVWHYHTFTQGWGDIGYNFLVDMDGVIYEGRRGGDDVIGTHAGDANAGSMAVSLIGNFVSANPPAAMIHSAVELFAWKAAQKNIDVFSAGYLPHLAWGVPHLMGHRDVYGTTACPGDQAHALLPIIRQQVAQRLGFISPHIYIDELGGAFTKSNANWFTAPSGCGFNGHAYYTWSTTDPAQSTNWGEWQVAVPESGRYELSVYAPYCVTGRGETYGARYTVHHANGSNQVVANHEANVGAWMVLGDFDFLEGNNAGKVRLTDLTTTDSGRGVWFDAIRLRRVDTPLTITHQQPAPASWTNQRAVDFQWQFANAASATGVRLQAATDPAFNDLIFSALLPPHSSSYSYTFPQDYNAIYWRVILITTQFGPVSSTATHFGIDTAPPTAQVTAAYRLLDNRYVVSWQGQDSGVGVIAHYSVEYRPQGNANWIPWLHETAVTSATFIPPLGDGQNPVYWFRVRATDSLGNAALFPPGDGDLHTGQAIFLSHVIMLPVVHRQ